jgi:hypothetical protein
MIRILWISALVLVTDALVGSSGNTVSAATYVYSPSLPLLFLGFGYDGRKVHFQRAPIAMIASVFPRGDTYAFHGPNGQSDSKPLDLNGLPFWIYAEYRDNESKCQYDFIGGLSPDPYNPLPKVGAIPVAWAPADEVVVRNCGRGFELVSLEGYDGGMLGADKSDPFVSHLTGNQPIGDVDEVRKGLIRDFVQRLLRAFGGKAALQNKLDESFKPHPYTIMEPLASALVAAGIRVQ